MLKQINALFGKSKPAQLPVILDSAEFERLMPTIEDFPRPEWDVISTKIDAEYSDNLGQAWQDVAHIWLTRLSYRLEQGYRVQRSREFILLSTLDQRRSGFLLETMEGMRERILGTLDWTGEKESPGLYTVLLFADSTTYFGYSAGLGPAGEEPGSVGQFFSGTYGHLALIQQEIWRMESTLAYLLVHYMLGGCSFPWWLHQGLCNHFADIYDQGEKLHAVNTLDSWLKEAGSFWSQARVKSLWDGSLLDSEHREKAEAFSLLLTRAILETVKDVPEFLDLADHSDAGASAVRASTGRTLADFIGGILGPGDWSPE